MKVNNFKDLTKLLALCRKQGVKTVEVDGIKLELMDSIPVIKPIKVHYNRQSTLEDSLTNISASVPIPHPEITTDLPSEEDLLFWSTGGQQNEHQ